jgi:hypothetical protein
MNASTSSHRRKAILRYRWFSTGYHSTRANAAGRPQIKLRLRPSAQNMHHEKPRLGYTNMADHAIRPYPSRSDAASAPHKSP